MWEEQPRNHGLPWSASDLETCCDQWLLKGNSVAVLAKYLGRTELAIRCKLAQALYSNTIGESDIRQYYSHMEYPAICHRTTKQPKQEKKMPFKIIIEKRLYVNDQDLNQLSDEDLIDLIKCGEAELKSLEEVENKPKILIARKEELQTAIMELCNLIDARHTSAKPALDGEA